MLLRAAEGERLRPTSFEAAPLRLMIACSGTGALVEAIMLLLGDNASFLQHILSVERDEGAQ